MFPIANSHWSEVSPILLLEFARFVCISISDSWGIHHLRGGAVVIYHQQKPSWKWSDVHQLSYQKSVINPIKPTFSNGFLWSVMFTNLAMVNRGTTLWQLLPGSVVSIIPSSHWWVPHAGSCFGCAQQVLGRSLGRAERIMELPCGSYSWLVHVSLSVDPIGLF